MKTLLLIPVILYTWLSLRYTIKYPAPPTNKNTYPTRLTDNPTNPIRNCNPKIHLIPNKNKYQNKYLSPV